VNDTTRELGGALGIAILGSIANSVYRSTVDLSEAGLTDAASHQAQESIGAATGVAATVADGGAVIGRAADAFTDAVAVASAVSGVIALAAAMAVAYFSRTTREDPSSEPVEALVEEIELELAPVGARDGSE
jgi:hypothetical protein